MFLGFFETVQGRDVRVIELREEASLAFETSETFLVLRELVGEDFDSDVAAELRVAGAVDLAHATFADGLEDLVVGELLASG